MKTGQINLVELAKKIVEEKEEKQDYIVQPAEALEAVRDEHTDETKLEIKDHGTYGLTPHMHRQLASWMNIPKKYYDNMLEPINQPLLRTNLNWWLKASVKKRLVRTQQDNARAFLSDRYRILDYDEVLASVLPTIHQLPVRVESCEVTERKMYVKMVFPETCREIKTAEVGDIVQAGFMISNSEIGLGGVVGQPFIYTLSCKNGAIVNDLAFKKHHIGRQIEAGSDSEQYFKDDTRAAEDRAFLLKLRDMLGAISNQDNFNRITDRLIEATEHKIEARADKAVEVLAKKVNMNENEHESVLNAFIKGGDLTKYGLHAAVTQASQDFTDYDRATEFEMLGGKIIDMAPTEWKEISKAA